jgi:hypothetical protein
MATPVLAEAASPGTREGSETDGLEDAMYGATLMHPLTTLAESAEPPRRGPRTSLVGAVFLTLAWSLLAGSFLFDVARQPRGAGASEGPAASGPGALASARPALPPCSP